ncbi:MAG: tetratricopeptide repeat protein [Bacillota bacterium]
MIQVVPFLADKDHLFLPLLARGLTDLSALRFNAVEIEAQVKTTLEINRWEDLLQQTVNENAWVGQDLWFTARLDSLENLSAVLVLYDPAGNELIYHDMFQAPEEKFLGDWETHLQSLILFLKKQPAGSLNENLPMYTRSLEAFLAFRKGLELLSQAKNERMKDEGLEDLLNAMAYDPDFIEAADILILFLMQNDMARNFERSVNILERLRRIANHHPRIPLVLAEVYFRWGNNEKTEKILKELVESFPQFVEGWIRLALFYHSRERFDEAKAALESVLAFKPEEPTSLDLMGAICASRGERELAREYWLKTIAAAPDRVNVLNNLALLAEEDEDPDKAESYYRLALKVNQEWWGTYFHYGSFCWRKERLEEAIILLTKASKLNPASFQTFQNLGLVQIQLGNYIEAQEALLRLLQLAPDNVTRRQTLQLLGQLNEEQIRVELRIRQFERLWESGKHWKAIGALIKSFNKARSHWYYWYLWGCIQEKLGAKCCSVISWRIGLHHNPGFPLLKKLGLCYWSKGKYRKALPVLRKAYQFHQSDQETACAYMQTLVNLGEVEELQANAQGLSQLVKTDFNQTSV